MALIQCLLGAASPVLSSHTYSFERDAHGRFVCEVFDLVHIQCLLSRDDIYREVKAEPEKPIKAHIETLLGSSILPSMIVLAEGVEVQLGTVVARAHQETGLSIEAWNDMPEADREAALALTVAVMKAELAPKEAAPEPAPANPEPAPEADPAAVGLGESEVVDPTEPEPAEAEAPEAAEQPAVDPVFGAVVKEPVAAPAKSPRRGRRGR